MYSYPVVIHFHRKNGDYAACSFSRKQADVKENLYYENDYFGAKFSFTVTSAERLDTLTFFVEIDGKTKDYLLRFNHYPLLTEVWILDGDETVYYSENPAIASPYYKDQNPFAFDKAFHSESFDHHWGYQGELGYSISDYQTSFKLWAPTATAVQVVVYENTSNDAPIWKTYNLERGNSYSYSHKYNTIGVWSVDLDENLAGKAYQYQIEFPHHQTLIRDPYTIATSPDGKRSVILSQQDR